MCCVCLVSAMCCSRQVRGARKGLESRVTCESPPQQLLAPAGSSCRTRVLVVCWFPCWQGGTATKCNKPKASSGWRRRGEVHVSCADTGRRARRRRDPRRQATASLLRPPHPSPALHQLNHNLLHSSELDWAQPGASVKPSQKNAASQQRPQQRVLNRNSRAQRAGVPQQTVATPHAALRVALGHAGVGGHAHTCIQDVIARPAQPSPAAGSSSSMPPSAASASQPAAGRLWPAASPHPSAKTA